MNNSAPRPQKDRWKNEHQIRKLKLFLFLATAMICFVFLCYRVAAIKIEHGEEYRTYALGQLAGDYTGDQIIKPNRGAIMDRNNQVLAVSSTVYNIFIDVRTLLSFESDRAQSDYLKKTAAAKAKIAAEQQRTLEIIYEVLVVNHNITTTAPLPPLTMEALQSHLAIDPETGRPVEDTFYLVIARGLKRNIVTELEAALKKEQLRHIYYEADTERKYIYDNLAAALIGSTRSDSWGLERYYNAALTGTPGRIFNAFSAGGVLESERVAPIEGQTLVTTLDMTIQQYAERVCEKYAAIYEAPLASAIVMNPNSAEVYAMAQYPTYNLNDPFDVGSITDETFKDGWDLLTEAEQLNKLYRLWANFNISSTFEPGSIYKPITVAGALEEGLIRTDQTFACYGSKVVVEGETPIPCHKLTGHGIQTLEQAIANSCNVAMMDIAAKTGRDLFYKYQTDFGYGDKTGIDLPAEAHGILHKLSQLNAAELATDSFGQRFTCTALQALTSFCATINGGNVMKPYIVSQIVDEKGQIVFKNEPVVQRKVISQQTSDYLRKAMESVVSPSGTGHRAIIDGWAIGGKTATGEQGLKDSDDYSYSLSFITYFPVENPQYAVLVLLHNVRPDVYEAGATPGYMIKELMLDIIKYKAIPPSYDVGEAALQETNMLVMNNYIGQPLSTTTRALNQAGLDYEIIGGSCAVVTSQFPAAGTRISRNASVTLTVEPAEGVALVEVPSVEGLDSTQAEAILREAGLVPFLAVQAAPDDPAAEPTEALPKIVMLQMPEPGIRVMHGTEIRLKIE